MILFQTMQSVILWSVLATIVLVWVGSKRSPLYAVKAFIQTLLRSRKFLISFISLVLILLVNKYELEFEQWLNAGWDFTPFIHQLEGQFVYHFQNIFNTPILTSILSVFYLVIFQALIISSLMVYVSTNQQGLATATCYAIMLNYLIALPFYLFVQVNEVWSYAPANVEFLMLHAFPTFEEQYRGFSGIDNCFPSLHTSISVTVALLASRSGNKRWMILTGVSAACIVFSIFYFGIHWLSDMIAGVALAAFASWAGLKLAKANSRNGVSLPYQAKG
ncbi:phosphatase PAP2 family protein [Paenibacillus sp. 1001270B_150601_E10]|uniref:phosphatase PAP2 family protein n=1 Tax=Paenibacillus sp. 1001270B_150601_E10 TaxID=2787079 RepID=UPI00189CD854|nr:phosphatase PAP2 family protein [Paenibacillus sp. 1001270B_150601_E10]